MTYELLKQAIAQKLLEKESSEILRAFKSLPKLQKTQKLTPIQKKLRQLKHYRKTGDPGTLAYEPKPPFKQTT